MKPYPLLLLALALPLPRAAEVATTPPQGPRRDETPLSSRDSAFHALNRLGYGPTPGLIDAVAAEGVLRWIDRQVDAKAGRDEARKAWDRRFAILDYSQSDLAALERSVRTARQKARRASATADPPVRMAPGAPATQMRHLGGELQQVAVVRATVADNQLFEVMADFWTNHFNVFYGKNLDRVYLPAYIEETIRGHSMGRFKDLLEAVAKSPAMLIYLDNAQSVGVGAGPPGRRGAPRRPTGLNENYARELLELHTLGVDAGYTQADVVNVARILTGWGIDRPGQGGGFAFHDWAHDRGAKVVMGTRFPAGHGEDEGERLLEFLANHPSTMHFVATKLCARFVSDASPDGCIDDAVHAWRESNGEIRQVLRAVFRSPDFWSVRNVSAKVKTPLEFVVSAVRAVGGTPDTTPALAQAVARLGQPLYLQPVPTGYPERQDDWVNSGALLHRMNLALALAAGRLPGVTLDLDALLPGSLDDRALIARIDSVALGGRMTAQTRAVIAREVAAQREPRERRALALGLALGGPEFQRQ